jgi:hypothetical protein
MEVLIQRFIKKYGRTQIKTTLENLRKFTSTIQPECML